MVHNEVLTKSIWCMIALTYSSLQALTDPQRKKSTGRSIDAMFYIVVTLTTPKNFKIRPFQGFEKIYVLYVAMAEKALSSGRKWFLR